MLVLERKIQEGFWIEDRIFVKVLGIGRKRVKLGIEAPTDAKILRGELRSPVPSKNGTAERIEKEAG
jgi:carbon storage regulator